MISGGLHRQNRFRGIVVSGHHEPAGTALVIIQAHEVRMSQILGWQSSVVDRLFNPFQNLRPFDFSRFPAAIRCT